MESEKQRYFKNVAAKVLKETKFKNEIKVDILRNNTFDFNNQFYANISVVNSSKEKSFLIKQNRFEEGSLIDNNDLVERFFDCIIYDVYSESFTEYTRQLCQNEDSAFEKDIKLKNHFNEFEYKELKNRLQKIFVLFDLYNLESQINFAEPFEKVITKIVKNKDGTEEIKSHVYSDYFDFYSERSVNSFFCHLACFFNNRRDHFPLIDPEQSKKQIVFELRNILEIKDFDEVIELSELLSAY